MISYVNNVVPILRDRTVQNNTSFKRYLAAARSGVHPLEQLDERHVILRD